MADKRLKSAFKEAAELAAGVPEAMREIAFNRALDLLLNGHKPGARAAAAGGGDAEAAAEEHEKRSTEKVLDQSLRVLNMATGVVGMEALTAHQIAGMIEDRFGIQADNTMVARALDGADFVVDRVLSGGDVLYKLVSPARLLGMGRPAKAKAKAKAKVVKKQAPEPVRMSATEIVNDLIARGFFNTARSVRDVLIYLERKGLQFTATQLYPAMMRLIKAGLLARERNDAGEYEYRAS